jgi:hypothetical protein
MAKSKKNQSFVLGTTGNDSNVKDVSGVTSARVQITASNWTAGSYQVMETYDGTNFVNVGSAVTGANASVAVSDAALAVKVHTTTAATAGGAAAVSGVSLLGDSGL